MPDSYKILKGGGIRVFLQQLINGITQGSLFALMAISFSMVWGLLRMVYFALGEIYMFSAFLGWLVVVYVIPNIFVALVISLIAGWFLGFIIEKAAFHTLRGAPHIASLICTLGFSVFLKEVSDYSNKFVGNGKVSFLFPAENIESIKNILLNIEPSSSLNIGFYNFPDKISNFAEYFSEISNHGWNVFWSESIFKNLVSQKISINLPQTVYRARQRDLEGVIEEIYRSLDFTVQARKQFCIFERINEKVLPEKHAAAVNIIGLNEAVSILTGSGLFENNESAACTRVLLSTIQYGLQQASEPFRLSMSTSIDSSNYCGKRFATIDQSLFPELFGFLPLQPENIESLIPPYESIFMKKSESQTPDNFAKEVSNIFKHFKLGCVPVSFQAETDKVTILSLLNSKSSFMVLPNKLEKPEIIEINKNQMRFDI